MCLQRRQLSLCDAIEVSTPQCRPQPLPLFLLELPSAKKKKHLSQFALANNSRLVKGEIYLLNLFQVFNAPPDVHRPQEAADYVRSS